MTSVLDLYFQVGLRVFFNTFKTTFSPVYEYSGCSDLQWKCPDLSLHLSPLASCDNVLAVASVGALANAASSSSCLLSQTASSSVSFSCVPSRSRVRAPASWPLPWPTAASVQSPVSACWALRQWGTRWVLCTPAACTTSRDSLPSM